MGPTEKHLQALVERGEIERDPAQEAAARRLDRLIAELKTDAPSGGKGVRSLLGRRPKTAPRGVYIHGGVGRGKTMLMDLFFDSAPASRKRRWHFHEFMADVHDRIGSARKRTENDPLPVVAQEIAGEARLVCLDELQVTDIADAMILGRLFEGLFRQGAIAVATSNASPDHLYWNGLNRQLFLPFISLLDAHMDTLELRSAKDYRLDRLPRGELYITPADDRASATLGRHFNRLTGGHPPESVELDVKGRKLVVPMAANGVALFNFADLCAKPLSSLDYLHIAHAFHTILVDGIPVLGPHQRNEARRLINLVDTLYDQGVCLIASAEAEPHMLFPAGDGAGLFERTASRLIEMRSDSYIEREQRALASGGHAAAAGS